MTGSNGSTLQIQKDTHDTRPDEAQNQSHNQDIKSLQKLHLI